MLCCRLVLLRKKTAPSPIWKDESYGCAKPSIQSGKVCRICTTVPHLPMRWAVDGNMDQRTLLKQRLGSCFPVTTTLDNHAKLCRTWTCTFLMAIQML